MKLPFFKQKNPPSYYLILLLREEWVTAIVFKQVENQTSIVGLGKEQFAHPLTHAPLNEWMETLDKAIAKAENNLPSSVETHKTLFGVREDWVEDSKIKKEYLETLKKVSQTLELEPMGFLVITETLTHYLQKQEGAPISAIFVEISEKTVLVNLVRAGRLIETTSRTKSDNPTQDTDLALQQLHNAQILPSRIIISQENFDKDLSQQFISHSWNKTLPFLHVPQILALPDQLDVKAAIYAAATQMGLTPPEEIESFIVEESPIKPFRSENVAAHNASHDSSTTDEKEEPIQNKEEHLSSLGFVQNADVQKITHQTKPKEDNSVLQETEELSQSDSLTAVEPEPPIEEQEIIEPSPTTKGLFLAPAIQSALAIPASLFEKFQHRTSIPSERKDSRIPKRFIVLAIASAAIFLFGLLYFVFLSATITISVKPETIQEQKEVTISVSEPNDFSKNVISGETLSVSENGSTTTAATGKKETGEKAKGTITLYSRLTTSKVIPAGTVLTSSNDLDFIIDKDVTVASSSADASASPSTAKIAVTASKIGKEYNLPSNTKFNVGSYSTTEVEAKNDSAFSGGSKTETTVVSEKDIATATKELEDTLSSKAKESIVKKIPENNSILPLFTNTTISKKEAGQKVGQSAKNLTFSATITYETITYKADDIQKYAEFLVKDRLTSDTILDNTIKYKIEDVSVKDPENATGTLHFTAFLLPQLNTKELQQKVKGASFSDAKKTIETMPQIEGVQITTNIPFIGFLPQQEKNIHIVVKNK